MWINQIILGILADILKSGPFWTLVVAIVTAVSSWIVSREYTKARTRKTEAEASSSELDITIKEKKYETEKYSKLLTRLIESEKTIEELTGTVKGLTTELTVVGKKLVDALIINQELMAEVTLLRTIKEN